MTNHVTANSKKISEQEERAQPEECAEIHHLATGHKAGGSNGYADCECGHEWHWPISEGQQAEYERERSIVRGDFDKYRAPLQTFTHEVLIDHVGYWRVRTLDLEDRVREVKGRDNGVCPLCKLRIHSDICLLYDDNDGLLFTPSLPVDCP